MSNTVTTFYNSTAWKRCREAYRKKAGGLCERCKEKGLITAADAVHHKTYITPLNVTDPNITLNFDNLELLCRSCHEIEHRRRRRYKVDSYGRVLTHAVC